MNFEQLLQFRALAAKASFDGAQISEVFAELADQAVDAGRLKQVCTPITPHLFEEFEQVTNLLGISKRKFLERCLIDGIAKAHRVISDVDVFENCPPVQEEGSGHADA